MAPQHSDLYSEELHSAIRENDVVTLKQLLGKGADPNTCYGDQYNIVSKSVLHIACGKGYTDCVRVLLEAGAMPDIHDKWGQTPLHYCLCSQFYDTATALLQIAGDKAATIVDNKTGHHYRSALYMVADECSLEGIKMLLHFGANPNDMDIGGTTPLLALLAAKDTKNQLMPAMKALVGAGADVNARDSQGVTALHLAARRLDNSAVEYLLSAGAEISAADHQHGTALTEAIRAATEEEVTRQALMELFQISISEAFPLPATPLRDNLEELVSAGVAMDLSDIQLVTALIIQAFGTTSADPSKVKALGVIETLTAAGSDLNSAMKGSNVLHQCLRKGRWTEILLTFFISRGANPDLIVDKRLAVLNEAIRQRDKRAVSTLLQHNCSLKTLQRAWGPTMSPMYPAVLTCQLPVVRRLLSVGDDAWRSRRLQSFIVDLANMEMGKGNLDLADCVALKQYVASPPSLVSLVVCELRSLMGLRLRRAVPQLPLPSKVKGQILSFNLSL